MSDKRIFDFFNASNEEAVGTTLEVIVPEVVKQYGTAILPEATAAIAGGLLGAVLPRVHNIYLGYKQKRLERNVLTALKAISERCDSLENRVVSIDDSEKVQAFTEMLLDNIVDEIQVSKVNYNVNGYINLLCTDNANESIALMFFRTLADLSDLDIRVLGLYDIWNRTETALDIMNECGIDSNQYRFIKEKLERYGLLQSKNDEIDENNMDSIVEYIKAIDKNNKKRTPGKVKAPKLKKKSNTDTYKITSLGMQYLKLMDYKSGEDN